MKKYVSMKFLTIFVKTTFGAHQLTVGLEEFAKRENVY